MQSPVIVTEDQYVRCLKRLWCELSHVIGNSLESLDFEQAGAAVHTANIGIEWLTQHLGDRVISRKPSYPSPARSPGLTSLDFYMGIYQTQGIREEPTGHQAAQTCVIKQEV